MVPHPEYKREGKNLEKTVPVDLYTLVLGGAVEVDTLGKTVRLDIPPGTRGSTRFRLGGLGMPELGNHKERGDLYVRVYADIPEKLTPAEKKLFEELRELDQKK